MKKYYIGDFIKRFNKYNSKKAIFYSALIFGIAHLNLPQGINSFFLGLIIGTVFYYTRSLYLCIIMHFTNNLLVNFVYYPTSELWTNILFIAVPLVGLILMITCFKLLNLKERRKVVNRTMLKNTIIIDNQWGKGI